MANRKLIDEETVLQEEPITPVKSQVICEKIGRATRGAFKGLIKVISVIADISIIWYVIKH